MLAHIDRHTLYRVEVTCSRKLRNVLIAGLLSCLAWTVFLGLAVIPALAQSSQWMGQTERQLETAAAAIGDLRVQVAALNGAVGAQAAQLVDIKMEVLALHDLQLNTLLAVLGLLITSVLGLIGVLWNLRSGWLKVKAE